MVRASKAQKKPGKLILKRRHKRKTQTSTEMDKRPGRIAQVNRKVKGK